MGPLNYREVNGQTHLKFVADQDGNIDHLATDDFLPVELIQRVHGLEQLGYLKLFGIGTIVICSLAVVIWFGGWIMRRRFKRPLEMTRQQARRRLASRIGAVAYLVVVVAWIALISAIEVDETLLLGGRLTPWLGLLYVLGILAIIGGIVMIWNGAARAMSGPGRWLARTGDVVLALAALYGLWAIFNYGLAYFHFNL